MSTDLAISEQPASSGNALSDLRSASLSVPVPRMEQALAEYRERRDFFRDWLKAQFIEGVHYGVPPGCEPRDTPRREQWQHKPSLYKAGADFVCDLMCVRPKFKPDLDAWQQLGSEAGAFVIACRLYDANRKFVGEGRGVHKVGQKKMDANGAIKMAEKKAKVDAVLNAYGLSDLFTQDLEDDDDGRSKGNHERVQNTIAAIRAATTSERLAQLSHWMMNAEFTDEERDDLNELLEQQREVVKKRGGR